MKHDTYAHTRAPACSTPESLDAHAAPHVPKLDGAIPTPTQQKIAVRIAHSVQDTRFMAREHLHLLEA